MTTLTAVSLVKLIQSVFPLFPGDKNLGILVDIPRDPRQDNKEWMKRRQLAQRWYGVLKSRCPSIPLRGIRLIAYPDVGSNNADLPATATVIETQLPSAAVELKNSGQERSFESLFKETQLFLAPTEYSTTAPLKNAAKKYGFRAATMPGFSSPMVPALKIDYNLVSQRVEALKDRLDRASSAEVRFLVDKRREYTMFFDLRFRSAHASSGRFPEKGTAGNLPSGEAYIVPYEGEGKSPSRTRGVLPVQMNQELVLFTVEKNRAVKAKGDGESAKAEEEHLKQEPAYGNMAELGFGVLGDFGLQPIGEILLDEKLGFHVAFGRSDHFGGIVGPRDFSTPREVIHLDRIYIPTTQPRISLKSIIFGYRGSRKEKIMEKGKYLIF